MDIYLGKIHFVPLTLINFNQYSKQEREYINM